MSGWQGFSQTAWRPSPSRSWITIQSAFCAPRVTRISSGMRGDAAPRQACASEMYCTSCMSSAAAKSPAMNSKSDRASARRVQSRQAARSNSVMSFWP